MRAEEIHELQERLTHYRASREHVPPAVRGFFDVCIHCIETRIPQPVAEQVIAHPQVRPLNQQQRPRAH